MLNENSSQDELVVRERVALVDDMPTFLVPHFEIEHPAPAAWSYASRRSRPRANLWRRCGRLRVPGDRDPALDASPRPPIPSGTAAASPA